MTELIQGLKDAPVMNLFVLVGFLLVVLAAIGRAGRRKVDTGGRLLSGSCGVGLLAAATVIFLGLQKARAAPPENLTPSGVGQLRPASSPETPAASPVLKPKEAAVPPGPGAALRPAVAAATRRLRSEPVNVRWGCDETVTAKATLVLPPDVRLVSAEVVVDQVERAKLFEKKNPTWDKGSRVCTGEVTFQGLDQIFFNCPGGGKATIRVEAVVAGP